MTSTYGYITVADLEAYASTDYSAVDADYTDAIIEAQITQAERIINVNTGTTFTGTIPDAIVMATLDVAMRLMYNRMIFDEYIENAELMPPMSENITEMLRIYNAGAITIYGV